MIHNTSENIGLVLLNEPCEETYIVRRGSAESLLVARKSFQNLYNGGLWFDSNWLSWMARRLVNFVCKILNKVTKCHNCRIWRKILYLIYP